MKKCIFLWLIALVSVSTFAQGNLKGHVIDEQTLPIPGAVVLIEGTEYYAVTNSEGQFNIFNVPSGDYELSVEYVGYDVYKQSVSINNSGNTYVKIQLNEGVKLEEVIISSNVNAQAKALNAQKNNNSMVQIVSDEQVEKFPDANIGDALKRLSGVNVQYDQGEARFANIRGTAPELSSITINGERVPSAEAEKRYVQLDLIPSDMIENIEVFKAVTPDMDADAIGGAINLETQKAPSKQIIKGTIGSGYTVLAEKPVYKGKLSYSNRFNDDKIGLVIEGSVLDKQTRSDNVEPEWDYTDENDKDGSAYTKEFQIRQYYVERLRKSFAATLDFNLNKNNNIFIRGMYNHRNDWENRYRNTIKKIKEKDGQWIGNFIRETKGGHADNKNTRLEDQRMFGIQAGGNHFFNKTKVDWSFSTMKASEERPNERYIAYTVEKEPVIFDFTDTREPKVLPIAEFSDLNDKFELDEITEEYQFTEEKDINFRLNVEIPVLSGENASSFKFGTSLKLKDKERDNNFYKYDPTDEDAFNIDALAHIANQTNDNFNAGDYKVGSFVSNNYLGSLDLKNTSKFEEKIDYSEMIGNFIASEDIYSGYLMYTQNIGEQWTLIGGVRLENTNLNNIGKYYEEPEDGDEIYEDGPKNEDSYTNILPGLHIKYSPNKQTNLRFAFTNTLARPNYYDIVPYVELKREDNEIELGNPDLGPTTSMNFDLLAEHFFSNVGFVSAGVFYKNLSDVIAERTKKDYEYNGNVYNKLKQAFNVGDATLYGFEVGIQRRLDFLPGVLNKLNLSANYTFNKSKLENNRLDERQDDELPLVGTPSNLLNTSLAYDSKKLEMRVSYSFADAFIEEYNDDEAFNDIWYDKVGYLDFNGEYKINNNWKIYLSLENLLNQPLRYYQGIESRTYQAEYYGMYSKLGVKFKF